MAPHTSSTPIPRNVVDPASAIASYLVRVTAEYTGRGPTRVRVHMHEDLITVVMVDTLTKGERSLVRDGEADLVLRLRRAFQCTMKPLFVNAVEQITGRTVAAFLSDNHIDPDVATETFVLEPRADNHAQLERELQLEVPTELQHAGEADPAAKTDDDPCRQSLIDPDGLRDPARETTADPVAATRAPQRPSRAAGMHQPPAPAAG